ncbi:IS1182 family transposase [Endozoicomonas sp. 4G]|uniref:IS1182 family transposase n=1 Tax=Endozoicomonas sp. 4G TaxID=2872754 RepID=UPI002079194E|nr:IS1182 family transposase [Endozoicomonas sp. 4G]
MTTKQKIKVHQPPQQDMFSPAPSERQKLRTIRHSSRRFIHPDADEIFLSGHPLRQHLEMTNDKTPFVISDLLDEQDWSVFEQDYAESGRPPYAPRCMAGLILYAIINGVTSLRFIERMARMDLGCMWVSGGIFPDHANIGRFITRHQEALNGSFFEALTQSVLNRTGSANDSVAGDGTLIEAACSNYKLIKEEAARAAVEESKARLEKAPDDESLKEALTHQTEVYDTLQERQAKQKRRGKKNTSDTRISPTEPEAARHKMKRGRGYAQAYLPSVLANEERVVLAAAVDPTNEAAVIPQMMDQAERIIGKTPEELLVDGSYFTDSVINDSLARDVSLLCPESGNPGKPKKNQKFHKGSFRYESEEDAYICPAGQKLTLIYRPRNPSHSKAQWTYGGAACSDCPLRKQCTTSKAGRKIRRFAMDSVKDELRRVMEHPAAKKAYKKRQGMVEPVFSYLRTVQGLNRFRRRGLDSVKLEFNLHLLAYNLSRAVAFALQRLFTVIWEILAIIRTQWLIIARTQNLKLSHGGGKFFRVACAHETV